MSTVPESGGLRVVARFILLSFLIVQATTASLADTRGTDDDVSRANGGYIESLVWLDANRDAIRDKNEIGLAGVSVSLLDCDGNFLRAQNTDQSGRFHFGRLAAGCYRLRYASMDGYRYCPANVGEDVGRDSDADPSTGLTKAFDLRVNQALTALDAGVVALTEPQIGDRVWEDMNANGVQDVGEPGLAKVSVALFDCSGGQVLGTDGNQRVAMTDEDGYFVFEDLQSACYQVRIDTPASYRFSEPNMTSELLDSDADPLSGMAHAGNVSAGQGLFNIDAGMYRTGTIGDWVWVDADNDNIQSLTESGLEGVQVMLLDADGVPQGRTVNTDIDGYYEFSNVVPGAYRLQFALPSGYFFGEPNVSSDPQLDSNANGLGVTRVFQLPSGGQRVDIDVAARGGGIPSLDVEKLTNGVDADLPPGPFVEVGGDVLWEYVVTNDGFGPLFGIIITDDQGVSITCPESDLAEGESTTCTGSTDDAQAGQYQNEVYACASQEFPGGPLRCDKDLSHYFGSAPAISLEKLTNGEDADTPTGPQVPVGSAVLWEYLVVNTGNVTLTNVTVIDDQGVSVTCPSTTLDPGVSMTCTGTGTAIAGQYANLGTVTGEPPVGDPVDDNDPSHYFGQTASIDIEKATNGEDADTPTGPFIDVGGAVNWTYVVTNTGSLTLNDIVVTDSDDGVTVSCPADTLEPGASFTCTASGTATSGQYMNDSGVIGQGVDGDGNPAGDPVQDADPSHYFGAEPAIDIEKATNGEDADTPTGPTLTEGDDVTWTYVVTNTGNVTLIDIEVSDDQGVAVSCPSDTLAPGASFTCTGTGTAEIGQYANLGSVIGQGVDGGGDPVGDPVTDDDPSHYIGEQVERASLGDKVFKDLNSNGQQDADEPGVPNVVVNLWTDDDGDGLPDTQINTTTTDSAGMYGFTDLDPDLTYVVQFVNDPAMNMPFTTANVGDDSTDSDAGVDGITGPIDLEPGENDPTIDAGIVNLPASLGDKVFKDLNADGQQDAGEPGVPGITVNLWTDDDGDGLPDTQINTTTTDANGMYGFTNLDPTLTYVVQFVNDPAMNMPFTTPNVGDDTTDSDAGDGGITGPINLASGENNPTIDAGLVNLPASLGDKVFKDLNANGQQDADEPGVPGITVNLWTDDDGDGTPDTQINTTTTDGNGMYGFTDLDPTLTYVVQFINDPAMNMPFTTPNVGDDTTDSDAGDGGITGPITLSSGENNTTIDAGLVNQVASLGDKVFKDLNADGQQDADEPGVPGITVNLWTDDDGDGLPDTQINTTTTDGNGMYGFTDLDPTLTYVVQFINDPAMNMPFTTPNVGDDTTDSDAGDGGITGPINLASGENNPTIDAGLVNLPASLGDKVFKDLDGDGQQTAGEPGVPGITVNLWTDDDGDGLPDTQIATTTTDANGMYGFANLDPTLTYVVQFINDPAMNMPFTTPNVGDDTTDSDAGDGGITGPITLSSGENNPTIDAGIVNLPAKLGDFVWIDQDRDGIQDAGEPGVPGAVVNLWTDDDGDGQPDTQIATTTTDANGMYMFNGLNSFTVYIVQFEAIPGKPFTTQTAGGDPTVDSNPDVNTGITAPVTLASGEFNPTIDAGVIMLGASIDIEKATNGEDADTPTGPSIIAGDAVNWTYVVTNTGELTLNNVSVSDDQGVTVTCPSDTLAPGASFTCTGSGIAVVGQYANLGSVTGQPVDGGEPVGDPVSDDDPSHYFGEEAVCVDKFVADHFNTVSYGNDDGDMNWSGDWDEHDSQGGGASGGSVRIENGMLVLADYPNSGTDPSISRSADTSGFLAAMLMFDWSISEEADHSDEAVIEVRNENIGWTELARYEGNSSSGNGGAAMFDISEFIGTDTQIRFRIAHKFGGNWDKFMVDNVRIDKKCEACTPGDVSDHFNHVSYGNDDGSMDWSGNWHENDPQGGGAHSGAVRVEDGMLVLTDYPNSGTHPEVRREVDLSGFNAAMLSFDWSISYEANEHDQANLWISSDGGHTWHLLDSYNGVHGQTNGNSEMYDISAFISDRTVISFQIANNFGAVWDKFMVDNVRVDKKCEPTDHVPQSCTANETHQHAFYFPNFNDDGRLDLYDLDNGATFVQAADGTAVLLGTIRKQGDPYYAFNVQLTLSGRTDTPPPGSPYNPFGADPSDWQYYPNWTGSLTGIAFNTGAHLSIVRRGASFQIGTGASAHNGEQDNNGGSGWFDWTANGQPNDCAYYGDCISHEGNGDVNVALHCD